MPRFARIGGSLLLVWFVLGLAAVAIAAWDLRHGAGEVTRARAELGRDVRSPAAVATLRDASHRFDRAHLLLAGPLTWPLHLLPVAGRQLHSATALSRAAATVGDAATTAVVAAQQAVATPPRTPADRVRALDRIAQAAHLARGRLDAVDLGPRKALVRPLADARNRFAAELVKARQQAASADEVTSTLAGIVAGPSRYLVLASNNAEMRAGSGTFLSAGPLTFDGGRFDLGEMQPTGDLLQPGAGAPMTGDVGALWGWTDYGHEWRNLAMSPRFDESAATAAELWRLHTGETVDGVIAVDVVALRDVVAASGPIEVGDRTITADNVEQVLFVDQYQGLAYDNGLEAAQAQRRELLGQIARAAVAKVAAGDVSLTDLGTRLAEAGRGRHLLAWSAGAGPQRAWVAAGVAGTLQPDSVLVALLNKGGNKLDQFVHVDATLDASGRTGPGHDVSLRLDLRSDVPEGLSPYVVGPHPAIPTATAGEYIGVLSVSLPGSATNVTIDGRRAPINGADGPTIVAAEPVTLARDASRTVVVSFHLPGSPLVIEPSARVPAIQWRAGASSWPDDRPHPLAL